jgi:hypothetical protein
MESTARRLRDEREHAMLARMRAPIRSLAASSRRAARLASLACVFLVLGGCAKDPEPAKFATVQGTVHHENGSPASADMAMQTLNPPQGADELLVQFSDASGHYQFTNLTGGTYVLSALDPLSDTVAGDTIQVDTGASVTAPLLTLASAGGFRGKALLQGATDHRDIHLTVRGFLALATSDSVGDYVLVGLPAGHWNVLAEHTGFVTASHAGTIATPGDTTALPDFVLTP